MKLSHIARTTGINARTIRRTMELWWKTGSVQRTLIERGRKERLNALDIATAQYIPCSSSLPRRKAYI
ncbi:hypothetical protein HYDPIDRAFT_125879 [Hydnomerulius pinastri MD-312]|nr:hypothetical protein HYDPIDRAFT_125879 [Hydnomerulius pinastri MD-312]